MLVFNIVIMKGFTLTLPSKDGWMDMFMEKYDYRILILWM